jgi:hypothetical protein
LAAQTLDHIHKTARPQTHPDLMAIHRLWERRAAFALALAAETCPDLRTGDAEIDRLLATVRAMSCS